MALDPLETLELEKQRTREFMAMAVHELRTPLTSLRLLTQCLLFQASQSPFAETARRIDRQSGRLVRLIDDLLNSVKADASQLDLKMEKVPISAFLQGVVTDHSPDQPCEVSYRCGLDHEAHIQADRDRLQQIFSNLLHNASIHAGPSPRIELTLEQRSASGIRIAVTDHGAGIAPEDLPRIFERFYQCESSRRTAGLGLGLHISRILVEKMGGKIWAESEGLGHGASFIVELPAREVSLSA